MHDRASARKTATDGQLGELIARYAEQLEAGGPTPDVEELLAEAPELREALLQHLASHFDERAGPRPAPASPRVSSPANSLEVGHVIGDCEILREIGRGGMGIVYLGRHIRVLDLRAVKVLPRGMGTDHAIKRFQREAQTAASIDHLNVVRIHDVGKTGDWHYIVMQYVEGKTLDQLIRKRGPLSWTTALRLLVPLLDALAAMHRQELIHRDIKPGNIMVSGVSGGSVGNHVVLMDFGLVHDSQDECFTEAGAVLGTPAYMAPEQARGQVVDQRADVYAVGATLYYLLTGQAPFQGSRQSVYFQVASGTPAPDLAVVRPEIPVDVRAVVQRAMHPSADLRYVSAEEMLGVVRRVLRTETERGAAVRVPAPGHAAPARRSDNSQPSAQDTGSAGETLGSALAAAPGHSTRDPRDARFTERMRAAREKLSAAEASGHFRWTGGKWQALAAGTFVLCAGLLVMMLQLASCNAPVPPTQWKDPPGMVYIPQGTVRLGATAERLRAHALTLDFIKDDPQLIGQFVECCLEEKLQIVDLPPFWIDRYEVTNAEYRRFVEATNHPPPPYWTQGRPPPGREQHPVVQVSYADAAAYAAWAQKKLPTIAQWTRAYRGDDDRMYPWGDQWVSGRANDVTNVAFETGTSLVTGTPADVSQFGVYNLVGNVDEIMREQTIQGGQTRMITKGGHSECRAAIYGVAPFQFKYPADDVSHELTGFRCVIEETNSP